MVIFFFFQPPFLQQIPQYTQVRWIEESHLQGNVILLRAGLTPVRIHSSALQPIGSRETSRNIFQNVPLTDANQIKKSQTLVEICLIPAEPGSI